MLVLNGLKNVSLKSKKAQAEKRRESMLLGIFIGTAVGTAVGITIQTNKGKQARKEVLSKAKDLSQIPKSVLYDSVKKIKKTKDAVVEKVLSNSHKDDKKDEIE